MSNEFSWTEGDGQLRLRPAPGATRAELSHDGTVWLLAWHSVNGATIDPEFDNSTLSGALKHDLSPEAVVPYVEQRIAAYGFSATRAANVAPGVVAAWDLLPQPA